MSRQRSSDQWRATFPHEVRIRSLPEQSSRSCGQSGGTRMKQLVLTHLRPSYRYLVQPEQSRHEKAYDDFLWTGCESGSGSALVFDTRRYLMFIFSDPFNFKVIISYLLRFF
jgi:hypothetical protein